MRSRSRSASSGSTRAPDVADVDARIVLAQERDSLCDTFGLLGPDAPTLCAGWTTADLAAHLVVRERDPLAGPGIVFGGPLARYTAHAMARQEERGYGALLERLRAGPPRWIVATMPALNVNENWIHHEDARRANGAGPRPADPSTETVLTGVVKRAARFATRRLAPHGLALELPDEMVIVRAGHPTAVLTGRVGECVLYLSGRRDAAEVTLSGHADAIEALRSVRLGL
jgi:uncharacterized protein (TIGR03085 family)